MLVAKSVQIRANSCSVLIFAFLVTRSSCSGPQLTTLSLLSATFLLEQLLPGAGGGVNGYFLHSDSKFAIPHFAMVNGGAMSWPRRCAAAY